MALRTFGRGTCLLFLSLATGMAIGACGKPSGVCLEATPGHLHAIWCEWVLKCQAQGSAAAFGDLGMSVNECGGHPSPFMQVLYASLGGVNAAEDVQRMNRLRFSDCYNAIWYRAACGDLLADSSLLMQGGYCSASYLKGEPTTLPSLDCNDHP